jgi:hypothetical protein
VFLGERTRDFAFVSLCYGRSGEEICTGYMPWPLAAECNMITNKQTNRRSSVRPCQSMRFNPTRQAGELPNKD